RFITLKRDNRGRIIDQHSVKLPNDGDGTFNSHNFYQYDKIGRVTLAHNSERVVQQQYHLNGQVSQSKQADWTLNYTFNQQGKRSGLTLPDGNTIGYQYNELGQLSGLTLTQPSEDEKVLLALEYNSAGLITQHRLGNGITLQQDYDVRSRLTAQDWSGQQGYQQQRSYQYDKKNQLTQRSEQIKKADVEEAAAQTEKQRSFSYNKLSQLVSSECKTQAIHEVQESTQSKDTTESFDWDAFGNPLVDKSKAKKDQETRVEKDRLLSFAGSDYRYDSSGNQIASTATGLIQKRSFDGLNQLRQLNSNGTLSQYQYDALGRRNAKITEAGKTDFIWDGNQLIGEHTNGEYTWYIYLPDSFLPVALIKGDEIYYYHLDQLGTPICLTDSNEQIVWQNQTDLFGAQGEGGLDTTAKNIENPIDNPLRFQGQYFDEESGLHYNRFRYYCPKQGRFIHQDPIGLAGGINPYQYAPNPVNWVDPFGLSCKEDGVSTVDRIIAPVGYIGGVTKKAGDDFTGAVEYSFANPKKALYAIDSAIGNVFDIVVDAVNYFPDALILKPLDSAFGTSLSVGSADEINARIDGVADGVQGDWTKHNEALSTAWESGDINDYVKAGEIGSTYVTAAVGTVAAVGGETLINSVKVLKQGSKVPYSKFVDTVDDFKGAPKLSEKSFDLFSNEKWDELEELFEKNNLNNGWPPNRGAISTEKITIIKGETIDRYGGYIDEKTGLFKDGGTFTAKAGEPFENRALPLETLDKPYNQYKVLMDIPDVEAGHAIPWFGQSGKGMQYELPLSIDELIENGFIKAL
ncbi:RHS repeat-associated core domain-containing protein, partial [Psychromonas antarctica]|uniref:RHS repeat-associated core domain-containing protein n=1 Tax=Psychromonas antarctica TaxID=67573 RepID=UPI001EE99459